MNTAIENLNQWGDQFCELAGAMFWQSSLLGLVLMVLDFGLRRHLRASVRYGLWLVFLVKLVTPPSLALPTGAAWWWSSATHLPMPAPEFPTATFTVTQSDAQPLGELPPALSEFVPPPPPTLTHAAWGLLVAGGVSAALLLWLLLRWRQVARTSRAANLDPAFAPLPADVPQLGKIRSRVRVKITDATMSPAVCGLFRPVILLPRALTEKLSTAQLRAVLLHELMHLRRGDVWVNFAQALIQILYWWHPLVWLANARIRRVREEAVDDAVMVALRDGAEIYAPTLLAVAKFAFQRPLASLGLVGILESRSALRERIERLVNFPAPRKAGLSLLSAFGILAFSAVALPMGDAPPAPAPDNQPAAGDASTIAPAGTAPATPVQPFNPYAQTGVVYTGPGRQEIVWKLNHINLDNISYENLPLSLVLSNLSAQARWQDPQKTGINFLINSNPDVSDHGTSAPLEAGSVLVNLKLSNVRLEDVLDAIVLVADHPIKYSIQDFGVVFSARTTAEPLLTRTFKIDPDTFSQGLEGVGSATFGSGGGGGGSGGGGNAGDNSGTVVPVVNMSPVVGQRAQAQNMGAAPGGGASGSNQKWGKFTAKRTADEESFVVRDFVKRLGVDLSPPKAVFFNWGHGLLFVRGTKSDTDKIERAIERLNQEPAPPKIQAPPPGITPTNASSGGSANPTFQVALPALKRQSTGAATNLFTRTFKVNPAVFLHHMIFTNFDASILLGTNFPSRDYQGGSRYVIFSNGSSVNLDPPKVMFVDQLNGLYVRASKEDLAVIERAVETMSQTPPPSPGEVQPVDSSSADNTASSLVQAGKLLYEMGNLDEAEAKLNQALGLNPESDGARHYLDLIKAAHAVQASSVKTRLVTFKLSDESGLPNFRRQTGLTVRSTPDACLSAFSNMLAGMGATLPTNTLWLGDQGLLLVNGTPAVLAAVEQLIQGLNGFPSVAVKSQGSTKFVAVRDETISTRDADTNLYMRTFKLSTSAIAGVQTSLGIAAAARADGSQMSDAWRSAFARFGVKLDPPKSVDYNHRLGLVLVKATQGDLDLIERVLEAFNQMAPAQLHIKARYIEVTGDLNDIPTLTNYLDGQTLTGIMGAEQTRKFLRQLESRVDYENIAESEVTTTSGRQTQMRATQLQTVIEGINPMALTAPGVSDQGTNLFNLASREFGTICDLVPYVLSDGYTANLTVIASLHEFAGYKQPGRAVAFYVKGQLQKHKVPVPNPQIIENQCVACMNLWDGQTLVLYDRQPLPNPPKTEAHTGRLLYQAGSSQKHLLVLATVSLVDAAGNRVHTDDEIAFAGNQVPPQNPIQLPSPTLNKLLLLQHRPTVGDFPKYHPDHYLTDPSLLDDPVLF